eukprot:3585377-Lingulodinium_polyedra.AAC.1
MITSALSNVSQTVKPPPFAKTGSVGSSTVDVFLAASEALASRSKPGSSAAASLPPPPPASAVPR